MNNKTQKSIKINAMDGESFVFKKQGAYQECIIDEVRVFIGKQLNIDYRAIAIFNMGDEEELNKFRPVIFGGVEGVKEDTLFYLIHNIHRFKDGVDYAFIMGIDIEISVIYEDDGNKIVIFDFEDEVIEKTTYILYADLTSKMLFEDIEDF